MDQERVGERHPLDSSFQDEPLDEPPPYESVILDDQHHRVVPEPLTAAPESAPAGSGVYGAPPNPDFSIAVVDPMKQGEGVGAFVSYKVVSTVGMEGYRGGRHDVIRRFRDFTWLKSRLRSQYTGAILPALPEKNVVEKYRMVEEFIEHRRAALAVFLNRVAAHPLLRESPDLRLFLQADETEFAIEASRSAAEPADSPAAAGARRTLSGAARMLRTLGQRTAALSGGGSGPGGAAAAAAPRRAGDEEEDAEYLRYRAYVFDLEGHLEQAYRNAAKLVRHHSDLGSALAEFGAAMAALAKHEEVAGGGGDAGAGAQALSRLGDRSAAVVAVYRRSSAELAASLEAPLKELWRWVKAAKKAMDDRSQALEARQAARGEAEARRQRLAKIRGTAGMSEQRVAEAERDVHAASAKAEAASAAYQAVAQRMSGELSRFQRERAQEMEYALRDFAHAEAAAAAEVARLWRALVPALARADAQ